MPEIIKHSNSDGNFYKDKFNNKFLFINETNSIKEIPQDVELCVFETTFSKTDIKNIKKLILTNKVTEFWICSNNLEKENIILANKIGIKTVISSPLNAKVVEDFFNNKAKSSKNKNQEQIENIDDILNCKVMIVDDNAMNIELLEEILSKFEIKISSFTKPKEAYKVLLEEKFDLFLLDVMMPDMSGFELAKRIKATQNNQNTPIIFISALSDTHNKIKGYNLGSFAYIEKPFDVNIIRTQIFNILKSQKAQSLLTMNKEDFLATVAHDLKTPIRAGINAINLLLNENFGEVEESQQEILEDLLSSTKYMQDMVENILCRDKIESSKITLAKQPYSLLQLIEHCIDITKYILEDKEQKIKIECKTENTEVPLDFLEMKRAIHNIITNASEYSPHNSEILITIFDKGHKIGFSVQDFGRGIDKEYQDDVFSQYMSMAKKNKTVGSGLGLYITKKIVEAHKGKIKLESKLGCGTTITVLLPKE